MPTAFDLIGHNAALQEHWIRRFIAFVIDIIIIAVVSFFLSLLFFIFTNIWLTFFAGGILWWLYSTILEGAVGATVGKRLVALHVVALEGPMDFARALIRNVSKVFFIFFLLDLLLGAVTQGDPRQRYLDRIARTTVTRVDQQAYMEEQFRMMQQVMPHPMAPPPGTAAPPAPTPTQPSPPSGPQAPPPGGWTQSGGWPGQQPQAPGWPQHQWDEEGRLKPQMRFCTNCGGQLVARGDGKLTCVRCGAVY